MKQIMWIWCEFWETFGIDVMNIFKCKLQYYTFSLLIVLYRSVDWIWKCFFLSKYCVNFLFFFFSRKTFFLPHFSIWQNSSVFLNNYSWKIFSLVDPIKFNSVKSIWFDLIRWLSHKNFLENIEQFLLNSSRYILPAIYRRKKKL